MMRRTGPKRNGLPQGEPVAETSASRGAGAYALRRRRAAHKPKRPLPRSAMLAGSGTDETGPLT